jgi:PAS domain S-box-containing protein
MAADRISPALTIADVEAALAAHGFGTDRPRSGAVLLALVDPLRIVWANQAAATLFDTTDADDLYAQIFAGRGREGLGGTVGRLSPDGSPRIERLRLIRGFRSRTLTILMSLSRLGDGRAAVVISAPGHDLSSGDTADFGTSVLHSPAVAAVIPAEEAAPAAAVAAPAVVTATATRERLAALRSARLLWQTDADGRLVRLGGGVPEMLGVDDPAAIGQPLAAMLHAAGADPDGRLAQALDKREPWSGLAVTWPLTAGSDAVAVTLGAAPATTKGTFDGFRGFGVADLARLLPALPRPGTTTPASPETVEPTQDNAPPVASPPAEAVAAEIVPPSPAAEVAPVAPAVTPASEPAEPAARIFRPSSKVVALRPYQTFGAFGQLAEPSADRGAPSSPSLPAEGQEGEDVLDLSTIEQSNFREIGRALLEGGDRRVAAPPSAEGLPAGGVSSPVAPHEAGNAARLVETLPIGVLVVAGDRLLHANPAFGGLTGHVSLDALQRAGGVSHLFGGLAPRNVLVAGEDRAVPLIGGDGHVLAMEGRMQPVTWDEAPASLITLRPAADRVAQVQGLDEQVRRREAELAESRATLNHVRDAILTIDRQGRMLGLNKAAEKLFGYAENGIAGEALSALIGSEAQAAVLGAEREPPAEGIDVTGRSATGKTLPLRMTWRAIGPQRFCIALQDQRGADEALRRDLADTRNRLDQALADKPDLLAKISHEIRTPLNAILGFAEVILDERFGPIGNVRYKAYLRDIHDSGSHVLSLLNDLLDLSKMEAGRLDMHPAAIDVNRVVGECVGEMQSTAHRERVIMRLSLLPHLSAALVDERAFRQIVGNILSNAINFNEPGGQVIVSTAMNETGAVAVRVRDTGIGMSENEITKALEPFRQIKTDKPGAGNGLGLPLARALVEANGATMSIKSRKSEGTLVEIVLPVCPAEPMRMPAE